MLKLSGLIGVSYKTDDKKGEKALGFSESFLIDYKDFIRKPLLKR